MKLKCITEQKKRKRLQSDIVRHANGSSFKISMWRKQGQASSLHLSGIKARTVDIQRTVMPFMSHPVSAVRKGSVEKAGSSNTGGANTGAQTKGNISINNRQ